MHTISVTRRVTHAITPLQKSSQTLHDETSNFIVLTYHYLQTKFQEHL